MTKYTYGLTKDDLELARNKIDKQKYYLENNYFHTATGQVKSLLDVSFSANISERYYAQLSNKINTMANVNFLAGLKPVFLTITLDGFFRGFLTADYKKWSKKDATYQIDYERHIPNNETYGFLQQTIKEGKKFTVKDLVNTLNHQWNNFAKSTAFKTLKKRGGVFSYIKAYEPHKDGVPHMHVLLWLPEATHELFQKDFVKCFPAPQNHKPVFNGNEGDTTGFQTAIHNPVGYIMKYATKSFMDLRTGEDLSYLQAWYIKHKIRRITTSHTTIPNWIYNKVFSIEKDWTHLTNLKMERPYMCEWSFKEDHFTLIEESGRCLQYDNGVLTLSYINSGIIISQTGTPKEKIAKIDYYEPVPSKWKLPSVPHKPIPLIINGQNYFYSKGEVINITPQPVKMSDFRLWQYFHNEIDFETVNPHHFAYVHNQMIERDMLEGDYIVLDSNTRHTMWGYDNEI